MSVASFGELLIDFVALETGVAVGDASGFVKAPGGAPANVAVGIAKLGQPSAFLGQVGDDPFGHFLDGVLRAEGVNTHGLRFSSEARTGLAFVSLRADGERSFVFYRNPSADMLMTPGDIDYDVINTARIFHYGSITTITEPSRSATLMAIQHARRNGAFISYDPNLRMSLWSSEDSARAGLLAGLHGAHLVKVSEEELEFLTGGSVVDPLWREDMSLIAVTRGAAGVSLFTRDGVRVDVPGFAVQAVDTTGAGDGFVAGLLVGLLEHRFPMDAKSLTQIARFANAVGAITTTGKGAIPSLPTRATVEAFLANNP